MDVSNTVLMGIKAVKDSKKVKDMFDSEEVQRHAFSLGFYESANWLRIHRDEYFLLYLQTDWDEVISLYPNLQN